MNSPAPQPQPAWYQLLDLARQARSLAVFSGAGMSTESGIPDYRSPGGVWTKVEPPTLREFLSGLEGRRRYWDYYREFFPVFQRAKPHPGHLALGRLHAAGRLAGVVTQNVDGLHQAGGVPGERVWELHGNVFGSACLGCGRHEVATAQLLEACVVRGVIPQCPLCAGPLKPRTISFGQSLDRQLLAQAAELCSRADLLLVVGSSLVVTPAAELPRITLRQGGQVAILNQQPTNLDHQAAVVIPQPAGTVLSWMAEKLLL